MSYLTKTMPTFPYETLLRALGSIGSEIIRTVPKTIGSYVMKRLPGIGTLASLFSATPLEKAETEPPQPTGAAQVFRSAEPTTPAVRTTGTTVSATVPSSATTTTPTTTTKTTPTTTKAPGAVAPTPSIDWTAGITRALQQATEALKGMTPKATIMTPASAPSPGITPPVSTTPITAPTAGYSAPAPASLPPTPIMPGELLMIYF